MDDSSVGTFPRAAAALARARAAASAPCSPCKPCFAARPSAATAAASAAALYRASNGSGNSESSRNADDDRRGGGGLLGPAAPLAAAELATGRAKASIALEEQGLATSSLKKELEAALGGLRAGLSEVREARRRRRRGQGLAVLGAVPSSSPPAAPLSRQR